ncbi:probable methyltransferase At1g29790 [Salvia miltiorrhiza]|uniref:probable methyltransferase At1g29790 n=1 Tax=Salvia miltiorrhiza TaxID=226208 RepID=UPI0025AD71C1|nr:probable methyltransferase At1g29790 [Salvia miltiorrhiza]
MALKRFKSMNKLIIYLSILAAAVCIATFSKAYSLKSFLRSDASCNHATAAAFFPSHVNEQEIKETLDLVIHKLKHELDNMRAGAMPPRSTHAPLLADVLGLIESAHASLSLGEGEEANQQARTKNLFAPAEHFLTEEIRKYIRVKPNRLGKQNFMGANGTHTSVGHGCFAARAELESYMDYDVGDVCNDDWKLAQKLMILGCDPLPRRRCFSRAPQLYAAPRPINESLWKLPEDRNVRWSGYRCKNFTCLASNATKKGFFKCADCFNLVDHELPRWIEPVNLASDFTIGDVLDLKRGEIRIGLDFSVGTGTFAARMKERNVTVVTATVNLGAPFSETIALRGLVPLYVTVNQRLPFFDNTLDLIHSTRFLDGWIDLVLLEFVVYDWDRVLRPGGLMWIDSFFCLKEDLEEYLGVFGMLRYKRHKWIVVPKFDKNDEREVFFSAVLEKPSRPFR